MADNSQTTIRVGNGFATVIAALLIGAGIAGGMFFMARAFQETRIFQNAISTNGYAEREVTSDTAKWSVTLSRTATGPTLAEVSAKLTADVASLNKFLKDNGVSAQAISVKPVSVSTNNPKNPGTPEAPDSLDAPKPLDVESEESVEVLLETAPTNGVTVDPIKTTVTCVSPDGFQNYDNFGNPICAEGSSISTTVTQTVTVESDQVEKLTKVASSATSYLVGQNVLVQHQSMQYLYSKVDDLKDEMITEATQDAHNLAEKIANASDATLDKPTSTYVNQFSIMPAQYSPTDPAKGGYYGDYGYYPTGEYMIYDTTSIEKKITVSVNMSYSLQ